MDAFNQWWEDLHPITRANLSIGLGFCGANVGLYLAFVWAARTQPIERIFFLVEVERLISTILWLLLFLGIFNSLRLIWQWVWHHAAFKSMVLAWGGIALLVLALDTLPNPLNAAIGQKTGRSYARVEADFKATCRRWVREWGDKPDITLNVAQEDVGQLREESEVFRSRNTVFFNFGEQGQDFGLACVLDAERPDDAGRVDNYAFRRLSGHYYQFHLDRQDP